MSATTTPVRLVLADDAEELRVLLAAALNRHAQLEVVSTASDGHAALKAVAAHRTDVLLLDLSMPHLDGLGVLAELQRRGDPTPVVVLTGYGTEDLADTSRQAGAAAYVEKGVPVADIADTILRAAA